MQEPDYVRWLRSHVGHAKVILVYASAIIPDEQGRILLQRRSDFSWWGLPGGALERGETLGQCAVREVGEETGLEVSPERLVGVYSSPDFDVSYPNGDQVHQFTVCFACRVSGGVPQPDGGEVLELAGFPPRELPDVPSWYRAMIEDYAAGGQEASFRHGSPGAPTSDAHTLWVRQFVGTAPLILAGGAACVRDEAGRVLLVRRADDGSWGLPAGCMELGERVDRAVARETEEETGLQVEPERLVGIYSGPQFFHTYPNGDQACLAATCFDCRVVGGRLRADGVESLEARFFPLSELPSLHPRHQIRIADTLRGLPAAVWR